MTLQREAAHRIVAGIAIAYKTVDLRVDAGEFVVGWRYGARRAPVVI